MKGFYFSLEVLVLICSTVSLRAQADCTEKWAFPTGTGSCVFSSPAIGLDGTIYVSSVALLAINPDGSLQWSVPISEGFSSPAVGLDGTIYVGSAGGLYAIRSSGTQKWKFPTGPTGSTPAIGADGTIYVGSVDGILYAIDPDGGEVWTLLIGAVGSSSPAIASDGTIYVGSDDSRLYAINPDGSLKWFFLTGGRIESSPAIASDGTIYVGSFDKKLYAINPEGTLKWTFLTGGSVDSSPAIASDGTIYVGSSDNKLYAVDPEGEEKWPFETGSSITSSPAVARDGTIYVGSFDLNLYAINPDGNERCRIQVATGSGGIQSSSSAIGADGTVYVGSCDGRLYAINGSSGGLADSPWPMFHHDLRHTGHAEPVGCAVELNLSYVGDTLNVGFNLGAADPATWNVWLSLQSTTFPLWSVGPLLIDPPISVPISIPGFPQIGSIGFLTTLTTPDDGIGCSDWETVHTGRSGLMPSERDLKNLFPRPVP